MFTKIRKRLAAKQTRLETLSIAFALVLTCASLPMLRANAATTEVAEESSTVLDTTSDIASDRIIVLGGDGSGINSTMLPDEKVTLLRGGQEEFATTRSTESVARLLKRLGVEISPLEMVIVDLTGEEVSIEIAQDFTYYETTNEPAEHTTLYTLSCELPKGEVQVVQQGIDGTRDVTYEVVYADGQMVSRQAVEESNNTSVPELAYLGTLVDEVERGDTILKVVANKDGSGYLMMASGDSLHFTKRINVTCTAYTDGVGRVDEVTATGTVVRTGCVAVDKRVIPLGTEMFITCGSGYTYGMAVAEDTGVRGEKVDLYMPSYSECISFGKRSGTVYILD